MRIPRWLAAALVVCAFAPSARAELDANETKWLKQCVDALTSKSAKVRDSGAAAIGKIGLEAVPGLCAEAARLKSDEAWSALTAALVLMGAKDAADAVDMARDKWPKGQEQRLGALVAQLRKGVTGPKPAAGVDAKVRELLEPYRTANMIGSEDAAIRSVVGIGRAAIPTLVAMLRECPGDHGPGMLTHAITDALAKLVNETDVHVLVELLSEGRLVAAKAFEHVRAPGVLDALLDTVERGFVSYDVVQALQQFASDPRVSKALVAWLDAHGATSGWEVSPVADYLGEHRVTAAVPVLLKLVALPLDGHAMSKVGIALAQLGRKEGIAALVALMEGAAGSADRSRDFPRHEAGTELNRIVGRRIYTGTFGPDDHVPDNADDAAKQFRAWWDEVKDKIRFDETRRAWVVG